jgi:hypothetical protein
MPRYAYRVIRTLSARLALASALILTAAGCSPDSPSEPPAPTTHSPSASATPTPSADADTTALTALWDRYWEASATAYAGPDPNPAIWAGIASDELTTTQVMLVQQYATEGIRYSGAPTTKSLDVSVDGDTAELVGCMDFSAWVPESTTGEDLPARDKTVYPAELTAHHLDGTWILTANNPDPSGSSC